MCFFYTNLCHSRLYYSYIFVKLSHKLYQSIKNIFKDKFLITMS